MIDQKQVESLLVCLRVLASIYQQLIPLEQEKNSCLAGADNQKLWELTKQADDLVRQIADLEKERLTLTISLAGTAVKHTELLKLLDGPQKEAMSLAGHALKNYIREFERLKTINEEVIEHLMNFVKCELNSLSPVENCPAYGSNGNDNQPANKNVLIDRKV